MKTIVFKVKKGKLGVSSLKKAAEILKNGGVIAFPTDTVYGLAGSAFNLKAQKRIYGLKGRSFRKPLILMAHNEKAIGSFVEMPEEAKLLLKKFWPGPLTMILPTTPLGKMMMGGRKDAGVRIPKSRVVLDILKYFSSPIATTSANVSSKPSLTKGLQVIKDFKGKVDLIIDCGICDIGKESTVVDMVKFPYLVVRQGCLSAKKILECINGKQ